MKLFSKDKNRKRIKLSFQWVLSALFFLLGVIPMALVCEAAISASYRTSVSARTAEVQSQCVVMANVLSKEGWLTNRDAAAEAELEILASVYDARVMVINSAYNVVKDTFSLAEGRYSTSTSVLRCFAGDSSVNVNSEEGYMVFTRPIYNTDGTVIKGVLLMSVSMEQLRTQVSDVTAKVRLFEAAAVVVLLLVSALLGRLLVIPLYRLAVALNRMAVGGAENGLAQITVDDFTETELIADAYNRTATRLKNLDETRQEFVSNVSHELKTPIAAIRVLADSLITGGPDTPPELVQEFLKDISDSVDREQKIIDDLLELVRADQGQTFNVIRVNVNELLEETMRELLPIAQNKNVELIFESFRPVEAELDPVKMSMAISNLIENAIKYNNEGGWVRVTLNADHKFFFVKVSDNGIGIPEEAQELVFTRFYRVDKARSRATGGTGLGLSITKSIINAHHGAIRVYSEEGNGTTFSVRVPLSYID